MEWYWIVLLTAVYVTSGVAAYLCGRRWLRKEFGTWTVSDRRALIILAGLSVFGLIAIVVSQIVEYNGDKPARW